MSSKTILISGAGGMIGSPLIDRLTQSGYSIKRLTRKREDAPDAIYWNIPEGIIHFDANDHFDAVIHLAGENIAGGRWTKERKQRILDSRVQGTRLLVQKLLDLPNPPQTFMCASGVGAYGDRGDTTLDESADLGDGFLADVCRQWEAQAEPLKENGVRVVHLRLAAVIDQSGGALEQLLPIFRLGIGGPIGSGKQYMPWISLEDVVSATLFCLENESLQGPVNFVSPEPITNKQFSKALGKALNRPALLPAPPFGLRLLFGEMVDEMLLVSTRCVPKKLLDAGFHFHHSDPEVAIKSSLNNQ